VGGERFKAFEASGWSDRAATYGGGLVARATARAVEPLLHAAGVVAGTRALEVAAGLGDLAAAAAARGALVTGVDLAEGMVAAARRRHPGIEFLRGDAEALQFADAAFAAVVAAFVVNHVPHPERAAAEMVRVVRPGGRVAVAMWGPPSKVAMLGLLAAAADAAALGYTAVPPGPDAQRFTDRRELTSLLRGAGLEEVAVDEIAFALEAATLDELWDGVLGGSVRTAARLRSATPAQRERAREELARLAERYRTPGGGYALPTLIRVAAGRR
jgi:SAM-dependent methyltransferase